MSKRPLRAYDKWNISVFIMTQICHSGQPSHGGDFTFTKRNSSSVASVLPVSSITEILIGPTRSRISYHLREIYSICICCWNGATHKCKFHNGKIDIISFVFNRPSLLISRCKSRCESDLSLSVVSFISFSMGYMRST